MYYDEEEENYFRRTKDGSWDAWNAQQQRIAQSNLEAEAAALAAIQAENKAKLGDKFIAYLDEISAASRARIAARAEADMANPAWVKRRDEIIALQPKEIKKSKKITPTKLVPGIAIVPLATPSLSPAEIIAKYDTTDNPVYKKLHTASAATFRSKLYKDGYRKKIAKLVDDSK